MVDVPTQRDIDEMSRLRKILESNFDGSIHEEVEVNNNDFDYSPIAEAIPTTPITASRTPMTPDPMMASFVNITNNFAEVAEQSVRMLVEEANNNPELAEAFDTERLDNGVRIGKWVIFTKMYEMFKNHEIKVFDIVHNQTKQKIVENLFVYDAAKGLVRLLNKGIPMNSKEAMNIMKLEEQYVANKQDAYRYYRRAKLANKKGDYEVAELYESRHAESTHKAKVLRTKLIAESNNVLK